MRYTVVLTPEPDGSAVNVRVPAMPGVLTWGRNEEEALASAREAIALHLEGYAERGQPAPTDRAFRARAIHTAKRPTTRLVRLRGRQGQSVPRVVKLEIPTLIGA